MNCVAHHYCVHDDGLQGASIATPSIATTSFTEASTATVQMTVTVANAGSTLADADVVVSVIKPDGSIGGTGSAKASAIAPQSNSTVIANVTLTGGVALWSTDAPVRKTLLCTKSHPFTKTGSGQTEGKLKTSGVFLRCSTRQMLP
jgi:hypothetical protein